MRKPQRLSLPDINDDDLERVALKADLDSDIDERKLLDPTEARNFKAVSLTLNEYEHRTLMAAVEKAGYKSAKQFVRDAFLDKGLHVLEGRPYGSA